MDRIRTLLLARTHVVVLDPDQIADAATRPTRDVDVEKFEDDLAQRGFVMSLDLAMTMRRLPYQAIQELRGWILDTLSHPHHRPAAPLAPDTSRSLYLRRILGWLRTSVEQPCPWCGQTKPVGALDPCGHLVCRSCWDGANFSGCPICHRRIALGDPFVPPSDGERVTRGTTLTLMHLAFDLIGTARERFQQLLARPVPLSPGERAEVETVIDAIGPKAVGWLPSTIPNRQTVAIAVARLWMVAADRAAMVEATAAHLPTASDVLRVAVVLMGGNAELALPMRLRSMPRGLRRAVLHALDRLPVDQVAEDVMRRRGLWKRVGERLHPFEWADRMPNATLAFALIRGTDVATASFGAELRTRAANLPFVRADGDRLRAIAWGGPIEDALRAGNPRSALARLTHRPGELLRRADHLVRVAQAHQVEALPWVLKAIEIAIGRGSPGTLLTLASHVSRRTAPWPRRVYFRRCSVVHAWSAPDQRPRLRGDAIGAIVGAVRAELVERAEALRHFPRAVIDRALVDLPARFGPRRVTWPRGSELAIPFGPTLRIGVHRDEPDAELAIVMFDADWRHVATCDAATPTAAGAIHAGDHAVLEPEALHRRGARHLVVAVRGSHGFVELADRRFALRGGSMLAVPLAIDLVDRRMLWLDVQIGSRSELARAGGFRAALAHVTRDLADFVGSHARPTLWEVASIHAAARANIVYVRERDGSITTYRRRDREPSFARLLRVMSGAADDGRLAAIPTADAPTWVAVITGDLALPKGSAGLVLDGRAGELEPTDIVGELTRVDPADAAR